MSGTAKHDESAEALRARLKRLEHLAASLEEALADFDHQARRLRDRLERSGGLDRQADGEMGLVGENLRSIKKELAQVRGEREAIERHLGDW